MASTNNHDDTPLSPHLLSDSPHDYLPIANSHFQGPTSLAMGNCPSLEELSSDHSLPANAASVAAEAIGKRNLEGLFSLSEVLPDEDCIDDSSNHHAAEDVIAVARASQQNDQVTDVQHPSCLVFTNKVIGATYVEARGSPLGEGAFWTVYEVTDKQGKRRALKVPKPDTDVALIRREAMFLCRVKGHKNVAEFLGEVGNFRGPCLLMELYDTYDFLQVILKRAPLSEDHVRDFGKQLAEGLQFIHEAGIIHCDLKPENVLVAPGMQLKISGFGLSEENRFTVRRRVGTPGYWAPEVVERRIHTCKIDVFSLGVILYNMFTRDMPRPALTDRDFAYCPNDGYFDRLPITAVAKELLGRCLHFDVLARANVADVLEHDFFRDGASIAHRAKHNRSSSAQEKEDAKRRWIARQPSQYHYCHVEAIRAFKVRRAAKQNEWRELLEQVEREQVMMKEKEDALREMFGSDFNNVRTIEDA
ncbi:Serine/threonine-protein kinase plk1 [Linnemannia zychae]|nr:Serine/threonine-protein kinase plk1 [Linnemannia zychae]